METSHYEIIPSQVRSSENSVTHVSWVTHAMLVFEFDARY